MGRKRRLIDISPPAYHDVTTHLPAAPAPLVPV
jgi:hypothetical protein